MEKVTKSAAEFVLNVMLWGIKFAFLIFVLAYWLVKGKHVGKQIKEYFKWIKI